VPFTGFTRETQGFFIAVKFDNSRENFIANKAAYDEHVKRPLVELFEELAPIVRAIDANICARRGRCVSGAYNDARFSRAEPIKEYMYLHFCAEIKSGKDVPGFFFDASHDGYRFGLQLYHVTAAGMRAIRSAAADDYKKFSRIVESVEAAGRFSLEGADYATDRCPGAPEQLKGWLNKKTWRVCENRTIDGAFLSDKSRTI